MSTTATKSRPILFSGPMVRAILDGRKTQTRRVVKPQPDSDWMFNLRTVINTEKKIIEFVDDDYRYCVACPYGQPGDELWVREEHYRYGHWEPIPGVKTKSGRQKWQFVGDSDEVWFEPRSDIGRSMNAPYQFRPRWYKRLARFMPRWASQITLTVKAVRVERLKDISEADAMAEGCGSYTPAYVSGGEIVGPDGVLPSDEFRDLWESINSGTPKHIRRRSKSGKPINRYLAKHPGADPSSVNPWSWDANPWVWVVEFERKAVG